MPDFAVIDPQAIEKGSQRPLNMEVAMGDLVNEGREESADAGHAWRGEP